MMDPDREDIRRLEGMLSEPGGPLELPASALIYGAGRTGQEMAKLLRRRGCEPAGFLDRAARLGPEGLPVHHPDSPEARRLISEHGSVVLGIFNPQTNPLEVQAQLLRMGASQVIPAVRLLAEEAEPGAHFWIGPRREYPSHAQDIRRCLSILADAASRKVFLDRIELGITGRVDLLASPDPRHQYFPPDIPRWEDPLRFVDCGAYDGDTFRQLENAGYRISHWAAFEPDEANYGSLKAFMEERGLSHECATAFKHGVWSRMEDLRFSSGQGTSSAIQAEGDLVVSCVALDEVDLRFSPNLIKMDIEGAEEGALLGAAGTIGRSRPGLAISAYHKLDHLWKLALLIDSWSLNYVFYLRSHAFNGFELVLYALPIGGR